MVLRSELRSGKAAEESRRRKGGGKLSRAENSHRHAVVGCWGLISITRLDGPAMHAQEEVEEAEAKLSEAENSHSHGAVRAFFTQFCTPVFLEALILTFLGGAPCTWLAYWPQG